jgi:phosphatidylserine/phosphatidylglycerophosphate/cardiolipin synthase-like enzyme
MAGQKQNPHPLVPFSLGLGAGLVVFLLLVAALLAFYPSLLSPVSAGTCASVQPLFSPGSSDEIVSLIRSSQKTIDVEMYVFTDETLARELGEAAKRGVQVRVILEPRVEASNLNAIAAGLLDSGVQVRWASLKFQLTHAKFMVIDQKTVLMGSINFSKAAQNKNREAAAIIQGPPVQSYIDIFETDWPAAGLARKKAN